MNKSISKITFDDKDYLALEVEIDGAYNFYAEEELCDAMEAKNECGCDLDNQIVFYPSREQLYKMEKFVKDDDTEGLKKYLQDNEIFYYKLVKGKLEGGLN